MDKNVIITGANRGIGFAMVKKFAENGCNVWACARKFNMEFEEQIGELAEQNGVWIKPVYFDLLDEVEIKEGITGIFKEKKAIHTLINNAGIFHSKIFQMHTLNDIKQMFDINVIAPMYIAQLILKVMARQKSGNIVNIASLAGISPFFGATCYGSTKAAIIHFTRTLAAEVSLLGNIRVNAIAPGHVDTDMTEHMKGENLQQVFRTSAIKRLASVNEIADVGYFLTSDEATFINGEVIRVDGGEIHGR